MNTTALLALAGGLLACANPPPATTPAPPRFAKKVHPPLVAAPAACDPEALERTEHRLESAPGIEILVRQIRAPQPRRGAVVLTHGAGSPSSSIWDLHFEDYSLMRRLACEGYDTYAVDVRGYGGSSMPPALEDGSRPPVRARDVMPDVQAAIVHAKATSGVSQVDLLGWSWGCLVSGMYAGLHPEDVRRLVLFAPVYDKKWPSRHAKAAKWSPVDRKLFYKYHDPGRERREVLDLHVQALFEFANPQGELLISNGPYLDIYGEDAPIWDPALVRAPTLVLRGEKDRASVEASAYRLFTHLVNADRRYVVLPDAGHFAFRTLRYRAFQRAVLDFLANDSITP